jgi:predicted NBD/HSP70 family sugar kinase
VKQVLDTAKGAFAQSTAAHHVAATAHQASAGDPQAIQKVGQLAKAATQGDPNAQQLINAAQSIAGGQFDLSSLTSALGSFGGGGGAMPPVNP